MLRTLRNSTSTVETVSSVSLTVQGCAQSVRDLYKKMVLGNLDVASHIHPCEYDENPDIDNPSILNQPGVTLEEVHAAIARNVETFKTESHKRKSAVDLQGQDTQKKPTENSDRVTSQEQGSAATE